MTDYNSERSHSTHDILTPDEAYESKAETNEISSLNEALIHFNKAANWFKRTEPALSNQITKLPPLNKKGALNDPRSEP